MFPGGLPGVAARRSARPGFGAWSITAVDPAPPNSEQDAEPRCVPRRAGGAAAQAVVAVDHVAAVRGAAVRRAVRGAAGRCRQGQTPCPGGGSQRPAAQVGGVRARRRGAAARGGGGAARLGALPRAALRVGDGPHAAPRRVALARLCKRLRALLLLRKARRRARRRRRHRLRRPGHRRAALPDTRGRRGPARAAHPARHPGQHDELAAAHRRGVPGRRGAGQREPERRHRFGGRRGRRRPHRRGRARDRGAEAADDLHAVLHARAQPAVKDHRHGDVGVADHDGHDAAVQPGEQQLVLPARILLCRPQPRAGARVPLDPRRPPARAPRRQGQLDALLVNVHQLPHPRQFAVPRGPRGQGARDLGLWRAFLPGAVLLGRHVAHERVQDDGQQPDRVLPRRGQVVHGLGRGLEIHRRRLLGRQRPLVAQRRPHPPPSPEQAREPAVGRRRGHGRALGPVEEEVDMLLFRREDVDGHIDGRERGAGDVEEVVPGRVQRRGPRRAARLHRAPRGRRRRQPLGALEHLPRPLGHGLRLVVRRRVHLVLARRDHVGRAAAGGHEPEGRQGVVPHHHRGPGRPRDRPGREAVLRGFRGRGEGFREEADQVRPERLIAVLRLVSGMRCGRKGLCRRGRGAGRGVHIRRKSIGYRKDTLCKDAYVMHGIRRVSCISG